MSSNYSFSLDPSARITLSGKPDEMAKLIQERQLKDRNIWRLFVKQFRECPDDEEKSWKGEYWGKLMRGGCITWQYTHDPELYEVLEWTARDMLTAQDEDGRFSTYSKEAEFHGWDLWCRKYILLGFLYFCEICTDDELHEQIVGALCRHLDYIIDHVGEGKIDITKTSDLWGGINSSSILEPVVKLYQRTLKKEYLEFAEYIVHRGGSSNGNIFELAYENKLDPYQYPDIKAYELMSCFEGLLIYSQITGSEKWKTAVVNFAHRLRKSDITVIGCAGCTHELLDHSAVTQTDPARTGIMQETCVTVTWMKLCSKLLLLTGDPVWADEIEKSAYNALYGSVNKNQNPQNGGLPFDSYSPLLANKRARFIGGYQEMENGTFFYGCCAAIGAAGTGLFPNLHFLRSNDELVFEFFAQGEIRYTNRMAKFVFEVAADLLKNASYQDSSGKTNEQLRRTFLESAENLMQQEPDDEQLIEQFDHYFSLEDVSIDVVRSRLCDPKEYWGGAHGVASDTQILKQADVVAMLGMFPEDYSKETLKKNLAYYEPRTEHGSSLSACMYALVSCYTDQGDLAYPLFMKSAQIDLLPPGKEWLGLVYIGGTHPASAGGAWIVAIKGFAGLRMNGDSLHCNPALPEKWKQIRFRIIFRGELYEISVTHENAEIKKIP